MTFDFQLKTHPWQSRLEIQLRWDHGRFELRGGGPFCDVLLVLQSDQAEVPYNSP